MSDNFNPFKALHKKQMEMRSGVLNYALIMEHFTSMFLKELFGVTKPTEETFCFGNKGTSLSFDTKIYLLMDIGAMDKSSKSKFLAFMAIRNQFMHNFDAKSYEECFNFLDGTEAFLLKTYKIAKTESKEEYLKLAVEALCKDVNQLTSDVIEHIKEKRKRNAELKFKSEMLTHTETALHSLTDEFIEDFKSVKNKRYTGKEVSSIISSLVSKIGTHVILGRYNEFLKTKSPEEIKEINRKFNRRD
ncbi:hypothetical protein CNR22_13580 [Sphingobacteriaceae bacterium]|nr:hypothetical protein CNR22_13580 [Sphingobacteriaceae bacterium]